MPANIDPSDIPPRSGRLTQRSELDISEAVQQCARLCLDHPNPPLCAKEYTDKLKASGWRDDDAQEVLCGALKVFVVLAKHYRAHGTRG